MNYCLWYRASVIEKQICQIFRRSLASTTNKWIWNAFRDFQANISFFQSVFSRISTEYEDCEFQRFFNFPYSVRIWENTDQENSEFGQFSGSVSGSNLIPLKFSSENLRTFSSQDVFEYILVVKSLSMWVCNQLRYLG